MGFAVSLDELEWSLGLIARYATRLQVATIAEIP